MTTDTKTPANREELIELRARAIVVKIGEEADSYDVLGDENKAYWRAVAAATLEADEAAGCPPMPRHLTAEQKQAIKDQPHSYMHSITSMWEAVKAASPYRKEG